MTSVATTNINTIDNNLLQLFAQNLLRHKDPYIAAKNTTVVPADIASLATYGPDAPVVLEFMAAQLDEAKPGEMLPTKEDIAKLVYDDALETRDKETRQKGFKLYAEIMGFVQKGTVNNTQNNVTVAPVIRTIPGIMPPEQAGLVIDNDDT